MSTNEVEILVKKAVQGDKKALEEVVKRIQDLIYNLAIKMLWHPDDAKDATQEILIKIITNLGEFKHKSRFTTWVYRVASNALINFKKKKAKPSISLDEFAVRLNADLSTSIQYSVNEAEQNLLIQEAKIGCSYGMLQCLTEENRIIYILGEILEFNSQEASAILEMTPENFRKKLSRTRSKLHQFLQGNCGLVNAKNKCSCHKKVDSGIKSGFIKPTNLLFARNLKSENLIKGIDSIQSEANLFQTNPHYPSPKSLLSQIKRIVSVQN